MISKKRLILLIFIIIVLLPYAFSGDNENYINQEISKLDKFLLKCDFVSGELYFVDDTIKTELLLFKRKDKVNKYLFCISRSGNDSIVVYTAQDILGYKLADDLFIKHSSNDEHYFIHKIRTGAVNLYMKERIPSDNRFLYYLIKSNSEKYYIINPYEDNIKEYNLPNPNSKNSTATISYLEDQGVNKKFKEFISVFMWDCLRVKNMVQSDFYTINSIPSIVDSYNNCLNSN